MVITIVNGPEKAGAIATLSPNAATLPYGYTQDQLEAVKITYNPGNNIGFDRVQYQVKIGQIDSARQ